MRLSSGPRARLGVLGVVAILLFLVVTPACGGLGSDCSDFCERVHECVDSNVNVDACEDACEAWADGNSDRENKVDQCSECVSQNDACSDATRRCTADCLGIPVR
ncbi:MAG TPA: hypothetical protein VM925_12620 [Labilithrix sp.]|nr:hypothetical protein [Labilithrix sp.]